MYQSFQAPIPKICLELHKNSCIYSDIILQSLHFSTADYMTFVVPNAFCSHSRN